MNFRVGIAIAVLVPWSLCTASQGAVATAVPHGPPSAGDAAPYALAEIIPGRVIHEVDAKYPKQAKKQKIQGPVLLRLSIDKNGHVLIYTIISGDPILAKAALDAVRTWRFEPYTQNGQSVAVIQNISFNFVSGKKAAEFSTQLPPPILAPAATDADTQLAGEVFRVGGAITAPRLISGPPAEYGEEARQAKYQGTCILGVIVGSDGRPRHISVVRSIGKGLDQKAIEAVQKWEFQPGTKDGKPVAVHVDIEVKFQLY